jgi:hypothetical protein
MDEEVIADLKQFISAEIFQRTSNLATKDDLKKFAAKKDLLPLATKEDLVKLKYRVEEIHQALEQSAIGFTSEVDQQVQDHEQRISRLERAA